MNDRDWADLAALLAKARHETPGRSDRARGEYLDQKLRDLNALENFQAIGEMLAAGLKHRDDDN